jgi:hypothetical protein
MFDGAIALRRAVAVVEGPPPPTFITADSFPYPNGVIFQARPPKQRLGALDAWNLTVQRQVGKTVSV